LWLGLSEAPAALLNRIKWLNLPAHFIFFGGFARTISGPIQAAVQAATDAA
jgi:hypothetical protein